MGANNNIDVNVTVIADQGKIDTQDFGTPLLVTDALEAGFTERIRFYESVSEVNADADLQADTQARVNLAFGQSPRVQRIAVGRVNYAVTTSDELDAIVAESGDWYGLAASSRVLADISDIAAWAETNARLYVAQSSDAALLAGTGGNVGEVLRLAAYARSLVVYHATDTIALDLGWLAMKLGKDPDSGSTTWRDATIVGVTPDDITSTQKANIETENANHYLTLYGVGATVQGTLANGNPIDTRITIDWLDARISESIAQLFLSTSNRNEKVPYDDDGISMVSSKVQRWLNRGESIDHLLVGSSSVVVPLRADIPDADVLARILRLNGQTTTAGAIEKVDITITVLFA